MRLRELIRQGCDTLGVKIIRGSVGKSHVHLLLSVPPRMAPAKLVQYLKGRSSKLIQEEFKELKKRYWGQHLWGVGYFCRSVGSVTEDMIKEYIENQKDDINEIFTIPK